MYITDDPLRDADRYDKICQDWLDSRPKCSACGEPIQEDYAIRVRGNFYCRECEGEAYPLIRPEYLEAVV